MKHLVITLCTTAVIFAQCIGLTIEHDLATAYFIGKAQIDITPPQNQFPQMFLAGFASRRNLPAIGSAMPLYARALALSNHSKKYVIVSIPVLGIDREFHYSIAHKVCSKYSIPYQNLLLATSHTHSGPVIRNNLCPEVTYHCGPIELAIIDEYTTWFENSLIELIGRALDNINYKEPISFWYGIKNNGSSNPLFGINRLGLTEKDDSVYVLSIKSKNNTIEAILFTYACHPVNLATQFYHPDWPGVAQAELEKIYPNACVLFIQGCAGDINPQGMVASKSFNVALTCGKKIQTAVENILNNYMQKIDTFISTSYEEILLPLNYSALDENGQPMTYDRINNIYEYIYNTDQGLMYIDIESKPFIGEWWKWHARYILSLLKNNTLPCEVYLPIHTWTFGLKNQLILIGVGGEIVSHYPITLKAMYPDDNVWLAAYCNEVPSYIPSELILNNERECGQYEAGWGVGKWGKLRKDPTSGADVTKFIAAGSMLFYGLPFPYKNGLEALMINALKKCLSQSKAKK